MKIFLLGGEGFVGKGFVDFFIKNGISYNVINRKNYKDFLGKKCDLFINANGNSRKYISSKNPILDYDLYYVKKL